MGTLTRNGLKHKLNFLTNTQQSRGVLRTLPNIENREYFAKEVNSFQSVTIFAKGFMLGFECASSEFISRKLNKLMIHGDFLTRRYYIQASTST